MGKAFRSPRYCNSRAEGALLLSGALDEPPRADAPWRLVEIGLGKKSGFGERHGVGRGCIGAHRGRPSPAPATARMPARPRSDPRGARLGALSRPRAFAST